MTQMGCAKKPVAGFTLIELLAGLSIATLLLALALPQWASWLAEQRVSVVAGRLLSGLARARVEAIQRGLPVRLCAAAQNDCATRSEWSSGWHSQSGHAQGWQTLRVSEPPPNGVRVEVMATVLQPGVVFESRGFAMQAAGGFASGSWVVCARGARQRTITLAPSGRARLSTGAPCS